MHLTLHQRARSSSHDFLFDVTVYFAEDGGKDCGVHGRDGQGLFFSIIDGPGYRTETTGLAFSPDKKFMVSAFAPCPSQVCPMLSH